MSDADDKLDFCKQALGEIGTRSTITSLDPPDGSPESYYCNLFFIGTRDQVLRAAHWNFAGRTDRAGLWKALPGTPENPTIPAGYKWSNRDPAPPWLYSYVHNQPGNRGIIQIRRVRDGSQAGFDPPWSVGGGYSDQLGCARFEVATDAYDRAGNSLQLTRTMISFNTIHAAGTGYRPGDYVTMMDDNPASLTGQPARLNIQTIDPGGAVTAAGVSDGGTFTGLPISLQQTSTDGNGSGFVIYDGVFITHPINRSIILTNVRDPIVDFTTNVIDVLEYDPLFGDAFMLALEGKLALALLGDKAMHQAKLQEANNAIIEARVRDANEGLTTYDFVPDWLQVRGIASMSPAARFFPAYGPLFAV